MLTTFVSSTYESDGVGGRGTEDGVDNFRNRVNEMLTSVDNSRLAHRISVVVNILTELSRQIQRVIHKLLTIVNKICKYGTCGLVNPIRRVGSATALNGRKFH